MRAATRVPAPPALIKEIEECLRHAAHCADEARLARQAEAREDFLRLEKSWRQLARSYEFAHELLTKARENTQDSNPDDQSSPRSGLH